MHSPTLSSAAASAAASAIVDRLAGGSLDLFDGAKPDSPDVAADRPFLARITLPSPAFSVGDDGSATLIGTPLLGTVVQTGAPTWGRFSRPLTSGATAELDTTVSTAADDPDIVTATAILQAGSTATILGFTLTFGGATP